MRIFSQLINSFHHNTIQDENAGKCELLPQTLKKKKEKMTLASGEFSASLGP
jgi:hypothetical protein